MKIKPISLNQINPKITRGRDKVNKLTKIIDEFDQSVHDAYKICLEPGEYSNLHSAYNSFHHAVVRMHRDKSIKVRTSSAEQCVYLIRTDISRGGST